LADKVSQEFLSPKTGEPYSLTTIHNDIKAVRERWREVAQRDWLVWVNERVGVLQAVEIEAWTKGDFDLVLKVHDRIERLLGLAKPTKHKHEVTGGAGAPLIPNRLANAINGMSNSRLAGIVAGFIESGLLNDDEDDGPTDNSGSDNLPSVGSGSGTVE